MKKICLILLTVALLFGLTSCGTEMFNGTQMKIVSISLSGVPAQYEGTSFTLLGGDSWSGGNGGDFVATDSVVTNGKLEFTITGGGEVSAPTVNFKLRPGDDWDNAIGDALRLGGPDVGNAKISNTWTGPLVDFKVIGTVNTDNTVTWSTEKN